MKKLILISILFLSCTTYQINPGDQDSTMVNLTDHVKKLTTRVDSIAFSQTELSEILNARIDSIGRDTVWHYQVDTVYIVPDTSGQIAGKILWWNENTEQDLAGYVVYEYIDRGIIPAHENAGVPVPERHWYDFQKSVWTTRNYFEIGASTMPRMFTVAAVDTAGKGSQNSDSLIVERSGE